MHDAEIHRRRALDLFHQEPVLRQVPVKPVVEQVIQPQRVVRVRRAVSDGRLVLRVQLVKMPSARHVGEFRRLLRAAQLLRQLLQPAVAQGSEFRIVFQAHLAGADRVVYRRLDNDPQVAGHPGFKADVVRDLRDPGIGQEVLQHPEKGSAVDVGTLQMGDGDVDAGMRRHGEAASDDMAPPGVQRRPFFLPVGRIRARLEVKADDFRVADVFPDAPCVRHQPVIRFFHLFLLSDGFAIRLRYFCPRAFATPIPGFSYVHTQASSHSGSCFSSDAFFCFLQKLARLCALTVSITRSLNP